ncbi:glycosyltransferase family 4 protein [Membranihabitans maritimus]|uniref:glycosyltransferase family 4 protein n=1 Tax=Membranihabitans maritimus TaxID=2904244 RepID=UPI001F3F17B6|nr:glycosyltransferase family 1 protein [Membranihabitans maritimus]
MKISIDATNIKAGGGLTHLKRIIEHLNDDDVQIEIIGGDWIEVINNYRNVNRKILTSPFKSILKQEIFKVFHLKKYLYTSDIAFIPGGTFSSKKLKYVSMSQNMLVFEDNERKRFPLSFTRLRYYLLEKLQLKSFQNANGIIYISNYAKNYIENKYPRLKSKKSIVIYHGISDEFRQPPKVQKNLESYSKESPFKLLYVSIVNYYKHQWNVIEAVKQLKKNGYPIELELIGPIHSSLKSRMDEVLNETNKYVTYRGKVPYDKIASSYKNADLFIFASTCENMPNILVEAMSSGLPILCSNYGPMPEVLKDAGVYMDPTNPKSIKIGLEQLLKSKNKRKEVAEKAYMYSQEFSWDKTSEKTFNFIKAIANEINKN